MITAKNVSDLDLEEAEEYAAYFDSNLTMLLPSTMSLIEGANVTEIGQNIKEAYVGNSTFSDYPAQIIKVKLGFTLNVKTL